MRIGLWLLLVGCGSTPHGHYDPEARRVCAGDVCYRIGELPGWQLVHQKGGQVAFFAEAFGAVAQANVTCRDDAEAAPLLALTRHLLIGYTEVQVKKRELVRLDAREALHSVVAAKLDGVPMVLDLYVIKRNGCIFDLSLATPPDRYQAAAVPFARTGYKEDLLPRTQVR